MLPAFLRLFNKKDHRTEVLSEIKLNLEQAHVFDQRQFISTPFDLKAWELHRHSFQINADLPLFEYSAALDKFNLALTNLTTYQSFYSGSLENKSRENAEVLHAKKEIVDDLARGLKPLIIRADDHLHRAIGARQ